MVLHFLTKEPIANFENQLIQAARSHIGKPAIIHQRYAGNCLEGTSQACREYGVGPDAFDCSGLVIHSICQTAGLEPKNWPLEMRHVRDMWQAAEGGDQGLAISQQIEPGSLLVTPRKWLVGGVQQKMPGHIGIVSRVEDDEVWFIHANPKAGLVEEVQLKDTDNVIGAMVMTNG